MRQPHQAGVLPDASTLIAHAHGHPGFKVRIYAGFISLDYAYLTKKDDQFAWPRNEMRGLILDEDSGRIEARPFQKFWNADDKGAVGTDWTEHHVILPKLDGSLVYPAADRWVTRGGITRVSQQAEAFARTIGRPLDVLLEKVRRDPVDGTPCTPCFEYISPDNQIVIPYDDSQLVLLAVRRIIDGEYWSNKRLARTWAEALRETGPHRGLTVVKPIRDPADWDPGRSGYETRLTKEIAGWPAQIEGVVIAFEPSGHRVKVKSREYVALHRSLDKYSTEKRVLAVWLDGNHTALGRQLSPKRRKRLNDYFKALDQAVARTTAETAETAGRIWNETGGVRKNAALRWIKETKPTPEIRALGFAAFNALAADSDPSGAIRNTLLDLMRKGSGTQNGIDKKVRPLLGAEPPVWNPPDGMVEPRGSTIG